MRISTSSSATGIPVPLQQDISMKLNLRLEPEDLTDPDELLLNLTIELD